jgi:DNA replication and repair protein RecF
MIRKGRRVEIDHETTCFGPHLDDFSFEINELDVKTYASQAQIRTTTISFVLSQARFLLKRNKKRPIVFFDDFSSELDNKRRVRILEELDEYQVFLTTVSPKGFFKDQKQCIFFEAKKGRFVRVENDKRLNS